MRRISAILFAIIFISISSANAQTVKEDTIPNKSLDIGIHTKYTSNGRFFSGFQLGVSAEYRFSDWYAIEGELSLGKGYWDYSEFGFVNREGTYFDFSIANKFYFGQAKKWYATVGFQGATGIYRSSGYNDGLNLGVKLGTGYMHTLKNGHKLNLGLEITESKYQGLLAGFKIGYSF